MLILPTLAFVTHPSDPIEYEKEQLIEEVAETIEELPPIVEEAQAEEEIRVTPKAVAIVPDNEVKEALVEKLGEGHPLIGVARCESQYRQYNADGTVLRGVQNPQDVGVLQINERYHLADSKAMGLDIHTFEGNVEYGEHLYETQGLKPWNWSKFCWSK